MRRLHYRAGSLAPSEVVIPSDQLDFFQSSDLLKALSLDYSPGGQNELRGQNTPLATVDPSAVTHYAARQALLEQFGTRDLHGFGIEESHLAIQAAGAIFSIFLRRSAVSLST